MRFKLDDMKIKKPKNGISNGELSFLTYLKNLRGAREALREKLKELGFVELQKSVFAYPFECEDEINFIVEVFQIRPFREAC